MIIRWLPVVESAILVCNESVDRLGSASVCAGAVAFGNAWDPKTQVEASTTGKQTFGPNQYFSMLRGGSVTCRWWVGTFCKCIGYPDMLCSIHLPEVAERVAAVGCRYPMNCSSCSESQSVS